MLEDLDFYQRYQRFHSVFEDLRKGIPEKEIEEIVAGILFVLEQHHVTYNQAREILNLVERSLDLRSKEVRL